MKCNPIPIPILFGKITAFFLLEFDLNFNPKIRQRPKNKPWIIYLQMSLIYSSQGQWHEDTNSLHNHLDLNVDLQWPQTKGVNCFTLIGPTELKNWHNSGILTFCGKFSTKTWTSELTLGSLAEDLWNLTIVLTCSCNTQIQMQIYNLEIIFVFCQQSFLFFFDVDFSGETNVKNKKWKEKNPRFWL